MLKLNMFKEQGECQEIKSPKGKSFVEGALVCTKLEQNEVDKDGTTIGL